MVEKRVIARKSVLIIVSKILDGGLGYLGLFFIARYMSPSDYGIVSFAMGFVTLFTIFTNLGFPSAHIKRISEGKDLGRCNGTFLTIRALLIFFAAIILLASLYIWTNVIGKGFETPYHILSIYIIIIYWVFQEIVTSFSSSFQAKKEIAKFQIPFIANAIVRTSAIIYVAFMRMGPLALAWAYVAGELSHLIMVLFFFKGYPIKKPTKEYLKSYVVFAIPLSIVAISSVINTNLDRVLIQLFWSSADVGYYFSAFRLTNFINLFTAAIGMLIFPTYSLLHSQGKIKQIIRLTHDSERHLSLIVFPMVFGFFILAEPATIILLSGWLPVIPIIQIFSFYPLILTLSVPYSFQFTGMNKPKLSRNTVIITVVVNTILNLLFIPVDIKSLNITLLGLGARGAALATVISSTFGLFYSRYMSYKITGDKGNPRILLHVLSAIIMAGILYVLLYVYDLIILITRWYHLLLFAGIGLGIYLIFLSIFREFSKDDFHFYLDTLNLKKMIEYIKDELKNK